MCRESSISVHSMTPERSAASVHHRLRVMTDSCPSAAPSEHSRASSPRSPSRCFGVRSCGFRTSVLWARDSVLPAPGTRRCRLPGLGAAGSRCLGGAPLGQLSVLARTAAADRMESWNARRSHKHMLTALPDGPPRRNVGKAPSRSASRPYCCTIR